MGLLGFSAFLRYFYSINALSLDARHPEHRATVRWRTSEIFREGERDLLRGTSGMDFS